MANLIGTAHPPPLKCCLQISSSTLPRWGVMDGGRNCSFGRGRTNPLCFASRTFRACSSRSRQKLPYVQSPDVRGARPANCSEVQRGSGEAHRQWFWCGSCKPQEESFLSRAGGSFHERVLMPRTNPWDVDARSRLHCAGSSERWTFAIAARSFADSTTARTAKAAAPPSQVPRPR